MSMMGHLRLVRDSTIEALLANPEAIYGIVDAEPDEADPDHLDLGKYWHILHYILTGEAGEGAWPIGFLLAGGIPIGEEDLGYGPARALWASEVTTLADLVDAIDAATVADRCSSERLQAADLYPGFGEGHGDTELRAASGAMFEKLRTFLQQAAATQQGLLVYLD
ncbi:YfbM family protein [Trichothermofontia sichuanensis B231]|uniref:YfbM family protein n=1 Tax=Trichothermofontia sichuanensis TaxID=3045816 RepID=UPI0022464683|nr:YfbM family protein [Trichothermofontia sichuanensis]UZQ56117.1 YfbM family protein [Trichothermofontia sichuanensis B231]